MKMGLQPTNNYSFPNHQTMNEEPTNETPTSPDIIGEEMKMPANSNVMPEPEEKAKVRGPVILIIGLLLLAILAGLIMWFMNLMNQPTPTPAPAPVERPTDEENNEPESTTAEAQTDNLEVVSTSDEISAIEADIEATDIEALDAELEAIEAELDAAF
jgi:hypothetical protein